MIIKKLDAKADFSKGHDTDVKLAGPVCAKEICNFGVRSWLAGIGQNIRID